MSDFSITCVIPTHARDDLLAIALASVLAQTYLPDAVVVVDDVGSPETQRLVRSYGDRATYLNAAGGENAGASRSRNLGASRAASTYLAFLDDDDRWEPSFLADCLAELTRSGSSLVAAWGAREVNGHLYPNSLSVEPGVTGNQALAHNPGVTGSNFLVRRSVFEALGGFDAGLPVYNDLDFFVRFLLAGHAYGVVPKSLVIQTADGAGHLSSRGASRAAGIEKYIAKHRTQATRSQLRRLRRDFHLAQRFKGQQRTRLGIHFVLMWANSSPRQLVRVIREKSTRRAKIYA